MSIAGPIIGAVALTVLPEYLRVATTYRLVLLGAILLVAILAFPNGLASLWTERRGRSTAASRSG
jgi:branched-chain amino acid transport system permease protein